ncbi:MAG: hypothetical protein PVJ80_15435 [Gemmatimonadota bacterium]|jgi:hypothetical protein
MTQHTKTTTSRPGLLARLGPVLALCVAAAACDSLLDVELPGQVTEDATFVPAQARLLVNSAIADIECGLSDFTAFEAAGYEDNTTRTVGWWGSRFERAVTPNTGSTCSPQETSVAWFNPIHKGRWMAEQVYDRLTNDWDVSQVADREELMGTAALYAGIAYTHFGEFFCEVMADSGPPMTWDEALAEGVSWFDEAITHIQATSGGDYEIATDVSTSALQMAHALKARALFAQNTAATDAQAAAEAAMVDDGFEAYVTRDAGGERSRWNRVYSAHVGLGWVVLLGPVDWWTGTTSTMPAFLGGGAWPATIPFTGYWDLAIDDTNGRAISDAGMPLTLADANTVADTRVPAVPAGVGGIGAGGGPNDYPQWEQRKYTGLGDDFRLASWEEARLIQALVEGGQTAIDLVNDIRDANGLPQVTYLTGASPAEDIEIMLLEELRRDHFLEAGRWWSAKLRYDLWFPRGEGQDQWNFGYQTGVRMVYPDSEYELNDNLTSGDQGSYGCTPNQNPVA